MGLRFAMHNNNTSICHIMHINDNNDNNSIIILIMRYAHIIILWLRSNIVNNKQGALEH